MKVLLASSSALANPVLEYLQNSTLELIGVITSPDVPRGRGREISENELAISARAAGLPLFKPNTHDEIRDILVSTEADLVVTLAYGRLIRARELELPRYGWLNIHFSILPRWRGAAPAQRALEAGDEKTGVTVFRLDAGLDTGPLFATSEYVVQGDESSSILLERLAKLSVAPLEEAIEKISTDIAPTPQSDEGVSLAPKLTKGEGRISWSDSNVAIERKIRAFNPWPTAWTMLGDTRISILSARSIEGNFQPGVIFDEGKLIVGCGRGALEVLSLKPEGKREMSSLEWMRGARLGPGDSFQ